MRNAWRFIRWPLLALLLYVGGLLLYGTLTDWQPVGREPLVQSDRQDAKLDRIDSTVISLLTWNVGYGGLGAAEDFYYNRGDFFWTELGRARAPEDRVRKYVAAQELTLRTTAADFFLLQEIDTASRRSYYTNQLAAARKARSDYAAYYAPNFQSSRVPIPLFQPWDHYGEVKSGLLTLSRYQPTSAERIQLPGEFGWPTRLFQLDRCALRQTFPLTGGDTLAVYNVHLSAYDEDGSLRREQMAYLRQLVLADHALGYRVIVGGDWNQLPPGFNWFGINPGVEEARLPPAIAFDYLPRGWQWAYDPSQPTVRSTDAPYDGHTNRLNLIDYFRLSPGLRLRSAKTVNQQFRISDHHPVYIEVVIE